MCGFNSTTIEIFDERRGNIFLNFGDISIFNPPSKVQGNLFTHDFSNPLDIVRINQVMKDEGFEEVSFSSKFEFLLPVNSIPSTQRNPYKLSERLFNHLHQRSISTHQNAKQRQILGSFLFKLRLLAVPLVIRWQKTNGSQRISKDVQN